MAEEGEGKGEEGEGKGKEGEEKGDEPGSSTLNQSD